MKNEALAACRSALAELGFVKRKTGFHREQGDGVSGWLGLNLQAQGLPAALLVNPVIGVRFARLAELRAELQGELPVGSMPSMGPGFDLTGACVRVETGTDCREIPGVPGRSTYHYDHLLAPVIPGEAALAVLRGAGGRRGEHGAESAEEHTRPSGRAGGESESPVKITHAFCCHEPDEASRAGVLVQVPQNGLHQAPPESSTLKSWQYDHVLKIEVQTAVPDHPRAPDDVAFVQGADREQGTSQALPR
jgi:hypothetical protein